MVLADEPLCLGYCLLDAQSVKAQALAIVCHALLLAHGGVGHRTLLGIVALAAHVRALHQGDDGQAEVLGEGIVAAVVCRNRHYGTRAIACQHVFRNVYGALVSRYGVDAVCAREDSRHGVVYHALALGAALYVFDVLVHGLPLAWSGHHVHEFTLRGQHEEGDAEHGVGTCGEDGEAGIAVCHTYLHLRTLAASYPVPLRLLDGIAPVDGLQSVQQSLAVCTDSQAPLPHPLLFHGIAATLAHSVHHLVVGEYGAQLGAPVHHGLAHERQPVVHQHVALLAFVPCVPFLGGEVHLLRAGHVPVSRTLGLEVPCQYVNGHGLLCLVAEEAVEHLLERPLSPVVVVRGASAHLPVPVERESYSVQLFAVMVYVLERANLGVLSCLYGVLFGWQSVGIVSHRVQHVVAFQSLVSCIDVACDVA